MPLEGWGKEIFCLYFNPTKRILTVVLQQPHKNLTIGSSRPVENFVEMHNIIVVKIKIHLSL